MTARRVISWLTMSAGHTSMPRLLESYMLNYPRKIASMPKGTKLVDCASAFYGTRDAALNWQDTLSEHLLTVGFQRGIGFPSVFVNKERDIWTLVHGDDYCSAGPPESLQWLETKLAERYEIKTQRVGHSPGCDAEGQILNRVVRATDEGFEIEADQRHS